MTTGWRVIPTAVPPQSVPPIEEQHLGSLAPPAWPSPDWWFFAKDALSLYDVTEPRFAGGADPTGVLDSQPAVQAAVDYAEAVGGIPYIPGGRYRFDDQVIAGAAGSTLTGLRILGAGKFATTIVPGTGFGSKAVFKFINARDSGVSHMTILGNTTTAVQAGVEFNCDTPGVDSPGRAQCEHLLIGRLGSQTTPSIAYGIRYTGTNQNNDVGIFYDVDVSNYSTAAYSFEQVNFLWHRIFGGQIGPGNGPAVSVLGASFIMVGTALLNLAGSFEFVFGAPPSGTYTHQSKVIGVTSEKNASIVGNASGIIDTTTDAGIDVAFIGYDKTGSTATITVVDFDSVGGSLTFSACCVNLGQAAQTFDASDSGATVNIVGGEVGFTTYTGAAAFNFLGCHHIAGAVALAGITGTLNRVGDTGGALGPSKLAAYGGTVFTLTDGANVAVNLLFGNLYQLAAGGSRTISAPSNGLGGQVFSIRIKNNTGGAITTTWDAAYKLAGAWTDPAAGAFRTILFYWDGTAAYELSRSAADIT